MSLTGMALTPIQRKKLLARVILRVQNGELDGNVVLTRIVEAVGDRLDDALIQEAQRWRAALAEARASAEAQIAAYDSETLDLPE